MLCSTGQAMLRRGVFTECRSDKAWKYAFKQAGLDLIREELQVRDVTYAERMGDGGLTVQPLPRTHRPASQKSCSTSRCAPGAFCSHPLFPPC